MGHHHSKQQRHEHANDNELHLSLSGSALVINDPHSIEEYQKAVKEFEEIADKDGTISKEQFKQTLSTHITCWSDGAQYFFMERLFDAFDRDRNGRIDYQEFMDGLRVFILGSPEEKIDMGFRLYDMDHTGQVNKKEMISVMGTLMGALYGEDQTNQVKKIVERVFDDFDENCDGLLNISEFQLMAIKEPIAIDFLSKFLRESTESTRSKTSVSSS